MVSLLERKLAKIIGKAAKPVFLTATLTRDVPPTDGGDAFDPNPSTAKTAFPCRAIHSAWSSWHIAESLVQADDVMVVILATSIATEPKPLDRITIRSETFAICAPGQGLPPVQRDPAQATWTCRARR